MNRDVTTTPDRNFVLGQGFGAPSAEGCAVRTSALLFQPRLIAVVVAAGVLTQSSIVFAVVAAVLLWCALLPRWNVFDAVYNKTLARRSGAVRLDPAPPPRRFAQGLAATFSVVIAAALSAGVPILAWTFEAALLLALAALVVLRFCLGSFLYHVLRGHASFALDTLPWARVPGDIHKSR